MTAPSADPMQAAMTATQEPRERTYFGEVVTVDAWFCVLEKGVGKRPFDPTRDDIGMRRTVIKLEIDPLKGEFLISQEVLHFETEWLNHTLPSLKGLGVELGQIKGKYVQVKRVPTGETYVNKQDNKTKDKTALVFERIFDVPADCIQAAEQFFASRGQSSAAPATNGSTVGHAELPTDLGLPPEQAFALRSLPALWKASENNPEQFKALIESNPMINKHYPWSHDQVQALVKGVIDTTESNDDLPF